LIVVDLVDLHPKNTIVEPDIVRSFSDE